MPNTSKIIVKTMFAVKSKDDPFNIYIEAFCQIFI